MKTAEEKAKKFIDDFKGHGLVSGSPFSEQLELNMLAGIERLLKEQDRDTRNACVESVLANHMQHPKYIESIIMNTKAV